MCVLNFSNFSVLFLCVRARRVSSYVQNQQLYRLYVLCIQTEPFRVYVRKQYNIKM